MGFPSAVKSAFWRIFDFKTRSSRSEFWWFVLFILLWVGAALAIGSLFPAVVDGDANLLLDGLFTVYNLVYIIVYFASLVALIGLSVRRFHDTDKSGWWVLIILAPFGLLIWTIMSCLEGTEGPNRFGDDPLGDPMDVFD